MRKLVLLGALVMIAALAQPANASFQIVCGFSHKLMDDPIVHPLDPGASHEHTFFGNTSTDAASTYASMTAAHTTCGLSADTSGYWIPSLIVKGQVVRPAHVNAYYASGQGVRPASVRAFPADLRVVAGGDTTDTSVPRPASWSCQGGSARTALPQDCDGTHVLARVKFPNCWDGVHTDSVDHRSHMAYSTRQRGCPPSHPVAVPALSIVIVYPVTDAAGAMLSSGDPTTLHGDFWNTWQQKGLERVTETCLSKLTNCGVLHD